MNERQKILFEISKLTDDHCDFCEYKNANRNDICNFECPIGTKLQEQGAKLIGVDKITPVKTEKRGITQSTVETMRSNRFKEYARMIEHNTEAEVAREMKLTDRLRRRYFYVNNERIKHGYDIDDEKTNVETNRGKVFRMLAEGYRNKDIVEAVGLSRQTISNYKREARKKGII